MPQSPAVPSPGKTVAKSILSDVTDSATGKGPDLAPFGGPDIDGERRTVTRCPGCKALADDLERLRHRLVELAFQGSTVAVGNVAGRDLAELRRRLLAHAELCGGGR